MSVQVSPSPVKPGLQVQVRAARRVRAGGVGRAAAVAVAHSSTSPQVVPLPVNPVLQLHMRPPTRVGAGRVRIAAAVRRLALVDVGAGEAVAGEAGGAGAAAPARARWRRWRGRRSRRSFGGALVDVAAGDPVTAVARLAGAGPAAGRVGAGGVGVAAAVHRLALVDVGAGHAVAREAGLARTGEARRVVGAGRVGAAGGVRGRALVAVGADLAVTGGVVRPDGAPALRDAVQHAAGGRLGAHGLRAGAGRMARAAVVAAARCHQRHTQQDDERRESIEHQAGYIITAIAFLEAAQQKLCETPNVRRHRHERGGERGRATQDAADTQRRRDLQPSEWLVFGRRGSPSPEQVLGCLHRCDARRLR